VATSGSKLIAGSKDQKISIITIASGGNFKLEKLIDLSAIPALGGLPLILPKSVDFFNGNLIVGLRNGSIIEIKSALDTAPQEAKVLVQSHFEGEAWGLETLDDGTVVTCGDDNRVMMFDSISRQFVRGAKISDKNMKDTTKQGHATTMSKMPVNK
jgi:hypothetical protein